jgi:acyl carrier protein
MGTEGTQDALRKELFVLISEIAGVDMNDDRIDPDMEFIDTGISSVEYLEFVDKVETRFDVVIDLESSDAPTSLGMFVDFLLQEKATG